MRSYPLGRRDYLPRPPGGNGFPLSSTCTVFTGPTPVSEAEADAYIERQVKYDPDVWVLEIEDRRGQYKLDGKVV